MSWQIQIESALLPVSESRPSWKVNSLWLQFGGNYRKSSLATW